MIHVIARVTTQPGKRDDFLAEFHKLVPSVLAEDGCVQYTPTADANTDIPGQQLSGDNTVVIVEQWETVQSLKDHLAAEHMATYRERVKDFVDNVRLEVFETISYN